MAELMDRFEVAAMVGNITAHQVKLAARRKELAKVKIGTRYLFREEDVRAWIAAQREPAVVKGSKAKPTALAAARRSRTTS